MANREAKGIFLSGAKMKEKAKILDKDTLTRSLVRIAHEILEKNKGTKDLCLIGMSLYNELPHSEYPLSL